jgi:cobalt-zinc-cadmium efflux system protein
MGKHHDHSHDHHHHDHHGHLHGLGGHTHAPANFNKAFIIGIGLNVSFVVIESVYGVFANSLALLADAGHNLSDVLGLVLAWVATILVQKKPSQNFTYGFRSSSILAAMANSIFLFVAIGGVAWEALLRFRSPPEVASNVVMAVAAVGILINGITAYLFASGSKGDLNIRGAYLHMLADALVSVGVVIAGFLMMKTGLNWIDPLVSLIVSFVILKGTWNLFRDSAKLALNAVPNGIDQQEVYKFLKSKKGVQEVHDLHIWAMSTTENALTAHLIIPTGHPGDNFLYHLGLELKSKFQIHHPTLQIEIGSDPDHPCLLKSDEVV